VKVNSSKPKLDIQGMNHGQQQLAALSSDRQSNRQQQKAASMCRPAGRTERSAARLASKPSRDCLRLLVGEAMLRGRVLLLRDSCLPAASRLVRRLLLLDKPRCWLASCKAVSNRFISDFSPCTIEQALAVGCFCNKVCVHFSDPESVTSQQRGT